MAEEGGVGAPLASVMRTRPALSMIGAAALMSAKRMMANSVTRRAAADAAWRTRHILELAAIWSISQTRFGIGGTAVSRWC